jgi:hypothetical protein
MGFDSFRSRYRRTFICTNVNFRLWQILQRRMRLAPGADSFPHLAQVADFTSLGRCDGVGFPRQELKLSITTDAPT